jgi:uncharacterized membrane protein (UPF0127 family)
VASRKQARTISSVNAEMRATERHSYPKKWVRAPKPNAHFLHNAVLHTATGAHPLALRIADHFTSRLRGLILAPTLAPNEGLLLTRCSSVHSACMRLTIDVIYLDRNDRVVRCVPMLTPWSASATWGAAHVLELAKGGIARYVIKPGDRLQR